MIMMMIITDMMIITTGMMIMMIIITGMIITTGMMIMIMDVSSSTTYVLCW